MINISIVFDHRGRTTKGKEGPLELRFIVNRKPYYMSTGIRVRASEFRYGFVANRDDADQLNRRLKVLVRQANEEVTRMMEEELPIDMNVIRRKLSGQSEDEPDVKFIDWVKDEITQLRLREGTMKHYKTLYDRLCQFGKMMEWKDLTTANIYKWDSWLHGLKKELRDADKKAGKDEELLSDAAVYNYHKCLKALLNRAVLFDLIERNPYERLKGQFKRGDVENLEYLDENEIAAFMNLHPVPYTPLAVSRDLFVFQIFTGLSFSDMQAFNIKDYKLVDGKWVNVGKRIKTGVPYVSQLLPPVVEVLENYGMEVPKISNADYNKCLKALGMVAGIEKPLHSHLARHTFATMMLREGVRIEHVSKMLGHTNIVTTQRYAKVLADDIRQDFDMVELKLKK
jgi:integrase